MENNNEIIVSVGMLAYNHGLYIEQAIQSVLMQIVNFKVEIVIAEDYSNDNTRRILWKYAKKYPHLIRVIMRDYNIGMQANYNDMLNSLRGKYIAFLDGDDYWVNPHKLQLQVDFLEKNQNYIATAHNTLTINKYGNEHEGINKWKIRDSHIFSLKDFEKEFHAAHISSVVTRNILLTMDDNTKNAFIMCKANPDLKFNLLMVLHGDVYVFNDIMSHYRFIIDEGTSWNASIQDKNMLREYYDVYLDLEKFALENYNTNINLSSSKNVMLWTSFSRYIKNRNEENKDIFLELLKSSNRINVVGTIVRGIVRTMIKHIKNVFLAEFERL